RTLYHAPFFSSLPSLLFLLFRFPRAVPPSSPHSSLQKHLALRNWPTDECKTAPSSGPLHLDDPMTRHPGLRAAWTGRPVSTSQTPLFSHPLGTLPRKAATRRKLFACHLRLSFVSSSSHLNLSLSLPAIDRCNADIAFPYNVDELNSRNLMQNPVRPLTIYR
ncbi:hypothetical protein L249_6853, partial [Ophiocordyceps polyrhachis-furcata BCC 54312]